jgi:hypothetical protein
LLSLCPFVVLSIWLGAATFKCARSTHHENILFLFVQITDLLSHSTLIGMNPSL